MSELWPDEWQRREIEAQLGEQHFLGELMILATRKPWVTQEEIDRALRVHEDRE